MTPPVGKSGPRTLHFKSAAGSLLGLRFDGRPFLGRGHQVFHTRVPVLDQIERRTAKLGRIVRRDRCGHADGDARGAVRKDIRKGAGQDRGLFVLFVVGRPEIDRVLGDALQQRGRHIGHPRFGVAHGGGVIAVDIAEVPLPVDQWIAYGKVLREANQRIVDRLVAMRVELAHDLADDPRALGEALIRIEA